MGPDSAFTNFIVLLSTLVAFQKAMDMSKTTLGHVALKNVSLLAKEVVPYGSNFANTLSTFYKGQCLLIVLLFISDESKHLRRFPVCLTIMKSYSLDPTSMPNASVLGMSDSGSPIWAFAAILWLWRLRKWTVSSCSQISARVLRSSGGDFGSVIYTKNYNKVAYNLQASFAQPISRIFLP